MTSLVCPVPKLMSLIGLLTAIEKQSSLRPVTHETHTVTSQKQLEGARDIRMKWWLEEDNVLTGQPLHPLKHALQFFTDASKEAHCKRRMVPSRNHIHINYLELKVVFLALKEFQDLCSTNIILIATDNTTVVAYITRREG